MDKLFLITFDQLLFMHTSDNQFGNKNARGAYLSSFHLLIFILKFELLYITAHLSCMTVNAAWLCREHNPKSSYTSHLSVPWQGWVTCHLRGICCARWSDIERNRSVNRHHHIVLNNVSRQGLYLNIVRTWTSPSVHLFPRPLGLIAELWHAVLGQINQCQLAFLPPSVSLSSVFSLSVWFCLSCLFSTFRSHVSAFEFLWLCIFEWCMWMQCVFPKGTVGYFICPSPQTEESL